MHVKTRNNSIFFLMMACFFSSSFCFLCCTDRVMETVNPRQGWTHHIHHNLSPLRTLAPYLRGGWCLLHSCCLGNRLCKQIYSRLWCRAPLRWRAAYCTSCRWSSWGETLCSGPSGPSRLEKCPASNPRTSCRTACRREIRGINIFSFLICIKQAAHCCFMRTNENK